MATARLAVIARYERKADICNVIRPGDFASIAVYSFAGSRLTEMINCTSEIGLV